MPACDCTGIAVKILALLNDAEVRKRLGQMGREAAEEGFDLKGNVNDLIRLYGLIA